MAPTWGMRYHMLFSTPGMSLAGAATLQQHPKLLSITLSREAGTHLVHVHATPLLYFCDDGSHFCSAASLSQA